MKKILYFAFAALCIAVSCQKPTPVEPARKMIQLPEEFKTLTASTYDNSEDVKTELGVYKDGKQPVLWNNSDEIAVVYTKSGESCVIRYQTTLEKASQNATFTAVTTEVPEDFPDGYTFEKAVYPSAAVDDSGILDENHGLAEQIYTRTSDYRGSFDPNANLMISASIDDDYLSFSQTRPVMRIDLKDYPESATPYTRVNKVTIIGEGISGTANQVTLDCTRFDRRLKTDGATEFLVVLKQKLYANGLQIVIETDKGIVVKKRAKAYTPEEKKVTVTAINLQQSDISKDYYWEGDYIAKGTKVTQQVFKIDGTIDDSTRELLWAPKNCGYTASTPNGKLYQWGRSYGFDMTSASVKDKVDRTNATKVLSNPEDGKFYYYTSDVPCVKSSKPDICDWYAKDKSTYLEEWTASPCPDGWRIPTASEMAGLINTAAGSFVTSGVLFDVNNTNVNNEDEIADYGLWAAGITPVESKDQVGAVYLPAAGYRKGNVSSCDSMYRQKAGYYWTATPVNAYATWDGADVFSGCAFRLLISSSGVRINGGQCGEGDSGTSGFRNHRTYAASVRCVKNVES